MANSHRPSPRSKQNPTKPASASASKRESVWEAQSKAAAPRRNFSWTVILVSVVLLLMVGGIVAAERSRPPEAPPANAGAGTVLRDDSHRLSTAADNKVTLVEFLDFECEACGAVYPTIEQLRTDFDGRVTFVARYFPIESHFNAKRAARAVEAAAQQGQFEAMYKRMYESQTSWAEQQVAQDALFRTFAVDLGLDMEKWDTAYESDATLARIQTDIDDGTALGVQGTPTFFLNGQQLTVRSADDLTNAIEAALAQ